MLRGENDREKSFRKLSSALADLIYQYLFFTLRILYHGVLIVISGDKFGLDLRAVTAEAYKLAVLSAAKLMTSAKQPDCL